MKACKAVIVAGVLAVMGTVGGCAGNTSPAKSTSAISATGGASSSQSVLPSHSAALPSSNSAAANEREFAAAMAASTITITPQLVAGPVMSAYVSFQHEASIAFAATGHAEAASVVSSIADGYQDCPSDNSGCSDYTGFATNATGQVTGVSVNGQPVAGRIASGADSTMQGLTMSEVTCYRLTSVQNVVAVVFKVRDVSYRPINNDPAVLATFDTSDGQFSADDSQSALPSSLSPGETAYGYASFNTTQLTGTLKLHSNDGYDLLVASSVIHKN